MIANETIFVINRLNNLELNVKVRSYVRFSTQGIHANGRFCLYPDAMILFN